MRLGYIAAKIFKKLKGAAIVNSTIHPTSKVESGSHIVDTIMDKHSFCGYDCEIVNAEIGSFCSIANNVKIGGGAHPVEWVSTSPVFYSGRDSVKAKFSTHPREPHKRTFIGHDVWIGQGTIVKQGVSIGTGAVVGMGSVVTKDVEPYQIVAGVPAKVLRVRFSEDIVAGLLQSKWWELDEKELARLGQYIKNPVEFLNQLYK